MDLNALPEEQRKRFLPSLFYMIDWFQKDGRLRDWERLDDVKASRGPISRLLLCAWLDRLEILSHVGLGWISSVCKYSLRSGEFVNDDVERYLQAPAVVEYPSYAANQTDIVFVAPKVGRFDVDFVMGRYELDYLGPEHDEVIRKQPPIAVICNDRPDAELTDDERHAFPLADDAVRAHGYKVIRFSGDEVEADAEVCARRVDEMFAPTWCLHEPGRSDHPFDRLMEKVRGR